MRLIGRLIEHLQRRIARYKVALDFADARDRRRSTIEIEWNGEMIGDLRRQSPDAGPAVPSQVAIPTTPFRRYRRDILPSDRGSKRRPIVLLRHFVQ